MRFERSSEQISVAGTPQLSLPRFLSLAGRPTTGFTLLELLVVIVIAAVLLGILLPVVQSVRESSRRSTCEHNLVELGVGLAAYHDRQVQYPVGTLNPSGPILSKPQGYHHNWLAGLLPHLNIANVDLDDLDVADLIAMIDTDHSVYAAENETIRSLQLPPLICPSATGIRRNTTCYAGIHHGDEAPIDEHHHGVFVLNHATRIQDIPDGLSHTLFVGEKLTEPTFELGWISGTRSSLRNAGHAINSPFGNLPLPIVTDGSANAYDQGAEEDPVRPLFVGGLQSHHPGGAYTLSGGGEVVFRADSTDRKLLRQLADKASDEAAPAQEEPVARRDAHWR